MTDRELLELAAKAADYDKMCWWDEKLGYMWDAEGFSFDPLGDDCDALRLAVKRRLKVIITTHDIEVFDEFDQCLASIEPFDDPYAATRRAITRAAAEIGKKL